MIKDKRPGIKENSYILQPLKSMSSSRFTYLFGLKLKKKKGRAMSKGRKFPFQKQIGYVLFHLLALNI